MRGARHGRRSRDASSWPHMCSTACRLPASAPERRAQQMAQLKAAPTTFARSPTAIRSAMASSPRKRIGCGSNTSWRTTLLEREGRRQEDPEGHEEVFQEFARLDHHEKRELATVGRKTPIGLSEADRGLMVSLSNRLAGDAAGIFRSHEQAVCAGDRHGGDTSQFGDRRIGRLVALRRCRDGAGSRARRRQNVFVMPSSSEWLDDREEIRPALWARPFA